MAVTVQTSGSQTATLDTEHELASITAAGTYSLAVDASAMVNGDITIIRVYGKARSGDTERLIFANVYGHVQAAPLIITVPIMSPHHFRVTLEQTDGTGRAYPWAVYKA